MKQIGDLSSVTFVSKSLFAVCLILAGCSDPQNYQVAELTAQQRTRVEQILTADQLKKLDDWINRNATSGKGLPAGVTVRQALTNQDSWLANKKIEEAKAEKQRKQLEVERAARQDKFARMLSVSLASKINKVQEDEQKFVALNIAYANKTDKEIRGVKGLLKLTDIYGDTVIDIGLSYDGAISAGQTVVDHKAGISVDKSVEAQAKLWNTDFDKLKSAFEVSIITFKDGTSIKDTT